MSGAAYRRALPRAADRARPVRDRRADDRAAGLDDRRQPDRADRRPSAATHWIPARSVCRTSSNVADLIPFARMALEQPARHHHHHRRFAAHSLAGGVRVLPDAVPRARPDLRRAARGADGPSQLTVIPVFILMRKLELIDTRRAVDPRAGQRVRHLLPPAVLQHHPARTRRGGEIDGAGHLRIRSSLLPLAGPALSALAILGFEASWNNYFGPLIFLSSPEKMTLPVGLVSLSAVRAVVPRSWFRGDHARGGADPDRLPLLPASVRGERRVRRDPRMTTDGEGDLARAARVVAEPAMLLVGSVAVAVGWAILRSVAAGRGGSRCWASVCW